MGTIKVFGSRVVIRINKKIYLKYLKYTSILAISTNAKCIKASNVQIKKINYTHLILAGNFNIYYCYYYDEVYSPNGE